MNKAHGLQPVGLTPRRVPWDTSHVVGFPGPPPPYRVVRTFNKLKIDWPIGVARAIS